MKVSDYIVEYLIEEGITDVFGYPGGMVTHLMESFRKYQDKITAHVTYHEQAAAFAACGYTQTSGKPGVAYATSGPGATNLITGICDAYFDSIPCLFITGQVNTFEEKGDRPVRQRGFQETDIISMVKTVTKYAVQIQSPEDVKTCLDKAFFEIQQGRKGPALLDIPMNIFRAEIETPAFDMKETAKESFRDLKELAVKFEGYLNNAKRPVLLLGNGIKLSDTSKLTQRVLQKLQIPVVTSMPAFDCVESYEWNMGFIGAYGDRSANFVVAKSDLILTVGSRLDVRQVGAKRENFAPGAQIVRIDIDAGELAYKVHESEISICCDAEEALLALEKVALKKNYDEWRTVCQELKLKLADQKLRLPNQVIKVVSQKTPENVVITTDVGQNQVWVAQSWNLKKEQKVLFSGGHGAMGYSLPAAIGAYYGSGKQPVICISGDGGLQMNIQELQFIAREKLPIKILVLNNQALGMIRHFQEMYFDSEFFQTKPEGGYDTPDFRKVAQAYGIRAVQIEDVSMLEDSMLSDEEPLLVEILIKEDTYVFPKLEFGKPNQDQEPLIDRALYKYLMDL